MTHKKRHSARSGKSVSQLVSNYFALIDSQEADVEITPRSERMRGALSAGLPDYEDAVLHGAAYAAGAAAIVTRNGKGFSRSLLPVIDPPELLAAVRAGSE